MAQHVLHSTFQRLRFYQSLVYSLLQELIVVAVGEVDIIATIDGCGSLLYSIVQVG